MCEPAWSRLGDPFEPGDVGWAVLEVDDAHDEVRVEPCLSPEALRARLDAAVGIGGWSVTFEAMPGEAVACHLTVAGVTKGAVAAPALVGGAATTAAVAFAQAARCFGARPPWPPSSSAWVACDPATFEPLHAPAPPGEGTGRPAAGPPASPAGPVGGTEPLSAPPIGTPPAGAPFAATHAGPAAAAAAEPPVKPEAHRLIDRLLERLKAQGQGLAAARILVRHGGYGKDPQAARELYAELRQLLLERDPSPTPLAAEGSA